jgi:hypothetical protein
MRRKTTDPKLIALLDKIAKEGEAYKRASERTWRVMNRMRKAQRRMAVWQQAAHKLELEGKL